MTTECDQQKNKMLYIMTEERILEVSRFSQRWSNCEVSVPPVKPRRRGSMKSIGKSDGDSDVPPAYPRKTSNVDASSISFTSNGSIDDDNCYKLLNVRDLSNTHPTHASKHDCIIGMEIVIFVN